MHKSVTKLLHNIKPQEPNYLKNITQDRILSQQHIQCHRVIKSGILNEKKKNHSVGHKQQFGVLNIEIVDVDTFLKVGWYIKQGV